MQDWPFDRNRNSSCSEKSSLDGKHQCYIDGSSAACFEEEGELWVKEYADGNQREGRTYKVNFCPQCGYRKPAIHYFKSAYEGFPVCAESDEAISKFSSSLGQAIKDMNHNISVLKLMLKTQESHNDSFMDSDMELCKEISMIKEEIQYIKTFIGIGEKCCKCPTEDHDGIFCRCEGRNIKVAKMKREKGESPWIKEKDNES